MPALPKNNFIFTVAELVSYQMLYSLNIHFQSLSKNLPPPVFQDSNLSGCYIRAAKHLMASTLFEFYLRCLSNMLKLFLSNFRPFKAFSCINWC